MTGKIDILNLNMNMKFAAKINSLENQIIEAKQILSNPNLYTQDYDKFLNIPKFLRHPRMN